MPMLMDSSNLHKACKAVWLNSMRASVLPAPMAAAGTWCRAAQKSSEYIKSMQFTLQALLAALAGFKASRERTGLCVIPCC